MGPYKSDSNNQLFLLSEVNDDFMLEICTTTVQVAISINVTLLNCIIAIEQLIVF